MAKVIRLIHLGMRGAYYFDLFAFTNNLLYRNKSSIFGWINNPPICSVSRFKALKILSLLMHNRFFFVGFVKSFQSDLFDNGVEVKISSLQRNFWCYIPNYLDLEKRMHRMSWYIVSKMFQIIWFLKIWYINFFDM